MSHADSDDAPNWVERAERALSPGGVLAEGDELLRGRTPPLLDADGTKAVVAPVLAAITWAAAVFREMVALSSLDPIGMVLRVVALGLTLRVVLLGGLLLERLGIFLSAKQYGLVLTPEGLLLRTPSHDVAIARDAVVGIVERDKWQARRSGRRWTEVFVVVDPELGRTHIALPPVFEDTPGLLAERLMRWRGASPEIREVDAPPAQLASRVYDDAAAGRIEAGTTAIAHGRAWLKKGPFAVVLVGVIALESILRAGPRVWESLEPWHIAGLFGVLLLIPLRWFWTQRQDVTPLKGISMVLTPGEALVRMKKGMLRTRWKDLERVVLDAKTKWSVLEGAHSARQVAMVRRHGGAIRYDEPYLGIPVEVAKVLLDAYRFGWLPMADASPSDPASDEEE